MKICVASKTKFAEMWVKYRNEGHNIISTWMDEVIAARSKNSKDPMYLSNLSLTCIKEAAEADFTVLFCERGENHKGSLIEIGAALGAGKGVRLVGACSSMRHIFHHHPNWREFSSIEGALTTPLRGE
ncbi:hypothetical protein KAR91_56025 [Candidatus Pacearchaeota archaeon]|nr:hypothetical protein [Candidatus Pacearchaeota archaeon]